ncbi:MAG: hypothetical protein AAF495_11225 [Pseudomonadota bacterium]
MQVLAQIASLSRPGHHGLANCAAQTAISTTKTMTGTKTDGVAVML